MTNPRKTLADMTPGERLDCNGMWADVAGEDYIAVIVRTFFSNDVRYAQMLAPEIDHYYIARLDSITPLSDLQRAWGEGGTPLANPNKTKENQSWAVRTLSKFPWNSSKRATSTRSGS